MNALAIHLYLTITFINLVIIRLAQNYRIIVKEIFKFIYQTKKWWLAPLIFLLLIVGLLVIFSDSAVAPFIYSLF